jgi:hypothetical protein
MPHRCCDPGLLAAWRGQPDLADMPGIAERAVLIALAIRSSCAPRSNC